MNQLQQHHKKQRVGGLWAPVYTEDSQTTEWRQNVKQDTLVKATKGHAKLETFFMVIKIDNLSIESEYQHNLNHQKRPQSPSPDTNKLSEPEAVFGDITLDILDSECMVLDTDLLHMYWDMVEKDMSDTAREIMEEEADMLFEVCHGTWSCQVYLMTVIQDVETDRAVLMTVKPDMVIYSKTPTSESPEIAYAHEWLDDNDDESEPVDILEIVKSCLKDIKKLATPRAIKMLMELTVVMQYVKLQEQYRVNPHCIWPCLNASLAIARRMGKGPYFAHKIHHNETFLLRHRRLPPLKAGIQAGHHTLLDNKSVQLAVRRYLAGLKVSTITPHELSCHVSNVIALALGYSGKEGRISERTAINWLNKLGYRCKEVKKGLYHDGHKQPDVIEARKRFLEKLASYKQYVNILIMLHLHNTHPQPSLMYKYDNVTLEPIPPTLGPGEQLHILVPHDEAIFHSNEQRRWMQMLRDQQPLRKKGNGRAIHVSDFCIETTGRLALTDKEIKSLPPNHTLRVTNAHKIIYPGKNHDMWWNFTQLLDQIRDTVDIFKWKHPNAVAIFVLDCSTNHNAQAPNALNVNNMNVNPGGKPS